MKGDKTAPLKSTGHKKMNITVMLTVCSDGKKNLPNREYQNIKDNPGFKM